MNKKTDIRKAFPLLKNWKTEWITDFSAFAKHYFPILSLAEHHEKVYLSESQLDFCRFIQPNIFSNKPTPRKSILAHRGYGKSQIIKILVLWYLSLLPHETVIYFTCDVGFANGIGSSVRGQVKSRSEFDHINPDNYEGDYTDQASRFDTPYKPIHIPHCSFTALSFSAGEKTGKRCSLIICDDLETESSAGRESFNRDAESFYVELTSVQQNPKPHQAIINLGTPHVNDSIHMKLLEEYSFVTRIWPAVYPDLQHCSEEYTKNLDPKIKEKVANNPSLIGQPCSYIPLEILKEKPGYPDGPNFRLQWQLDTTIHQGDIYPFKISDLIFASVNRDSLPNRLLWSNDEEQIIQVPCPGFVGDGFYRHKPIHSSVKYSPPHKTVMFIDVAGGSGSDEEVYVIMSALLGNIFLLDIDGFLGENKKKDHALTIALAAQNYNVDKIVLESNQGVELPANSIKSALQNIKYRCGVDTKFQTGNKASRIYSTLYYLLNQHRLVVNRSLIQKDATRKSFSKTYQFFYQLAHFQNIKDCGLRHDDRLDAVSSCVNQLTSFVSADIDSIEEDHLVAYNREFTNWLKGKGEEEDPTVRMYKSEYNPGAYNIGDPFPFEEQHDSRSLKSYVNNFRLYEDPLNPGWL